MKRLCQLFLPAILCLFAPRIFAQPANDDPCNALELGIVAGAACSPDMPQSWSGATATPGLATPFCGSYTTGDVWFKFTLTETADIFITTLPGGGGGAITDGAMELYGGDPCNGVLYRIVCNDDSGPGAMPEIALGAQSPGTYYIRFWDYADKTTAVFGGICVAAQPVPAAAVNDEPCAAIGLSVAAGDSCTPGTPYNWVYASGTYGVGAPGCGGYQTGDVWFKFSLSDTSDISIKTLAGTGPEGITDGALAFYSASACDQALNLLLCVNNQGSDPMPGFSTIGVLPGNYFIRFWDVDAKTTANIGGICVSAKASEATPISNDEPCTAIPLALVNGASCTPSNTIAWANATASQGFAAPGCGSYTTGDIWFSFDLNEASDILITTEAGIVTDGAMALYLADSCTGTFTQVICDDDSGPGNMPQIQLFALPAGHYFIRFWDYDDKVSGSIGGICVAAVPTISTVFNDNCITALPFPAIPANGDCSEMAVNTVGATGAPLSNCGAIADDDVWCSFTVPPGITQIAFQISSNGSPVDQGLRVYNGACNPLVSVACFTTSQGIITGLSPNATYLLRTYTIPDDDGAAYSICLRAALPPPNDEPCGATLIPTASGADCTPTGPFSWSTATASPGLPDPGCGSYSTGDVWFKFELDFKADIVIKTAAGTGPDGIVDAGMALYAAADCNNLIQLTCNDDVTPTNYMPEIRDFALSAGVYYLRIWDYEDKVSGNIGGICVAAVPTVSTAVNDLCVDALPFPAIPADGSCASVHVNTAGATGGQSPPAGGFADDDVWYSFKVPGGATRLLYEVTTNSGNGQQALYLYDACGYNAPLFTDFENLSGVFNGLIPDQTYYLRVYTIEQNVTSDFNICLKTAPPPPLNDDCTHAFAFPAIPTDGSCATVTVDGRWATNDGPFSCNSYESGDVWFSFVVPNNVTELVAQITSTEQSNETEYFELMSGNCNSQVSLGCYAQDDPLRLYNLIPGQTYYIRAFVYSEYAVPEYDICLHTPLSPPPPNDLCQNAIPFPTIPTNGACASVTAKTEGATGDNDDSCYGVFDDDVWFTFTVPPGVSSLLVYWTTISGAPNQIVNIYSGNCNNLVDIGCHADDQNIINGLVGGQTYYLRAYTWFANESAEFEICLKTPPPPPANDECPDATAFPAIPLNGAWASVSGTTMSAHQTAGLQPCNGWDDDDVWYTFTVPAGQDRLIYNINVPNDFNDYGAVIELYEGDCGSLNLLGCYDESNGHFGGLTAGQTYRLRIYSLEENDFIQFTLQMRVALPVPNDICEQAMAFPPLPADGSCIAMTVNTAGAGGDPESGCYGIMDDDVWFAFVVPADRTAVITDLSVFFGDFTQMLVYGGRCDSLVPVECFFIADGLEDISGLEPGQKYYLQLYTKKLGTSSQFTLCLAAAPAPPPNDDCVNATSITGAPGVFADPGLQTTAGATGSDQPLCVQFDSGSPDGIYRPYDVWYSFTTDEDGGDAVVSFTYDDNPVLGQYAFFYLGAEAFSGSCGDFSTLWCAEYPANEWNAVPFYGLAGNTTYYFRLFPLGASGNYAPVDFTLSAEGTALEPASGLPEQPSTSLPGKVRVFPSPASSQITVRFDASSAGEVRVVILDVMGRIAGEQSLSTQPGGNQTTLSVKDLPAGLYTLWVDGREGRFEGTRFVKQ